MKEIRLKVVERKDYEVGIGGIYVECLCKERIWVEIPPYVTLCNECGRRYMLDEEWEGEGVRRLRELKELRFR